jgi:hypothetical protein
MLLLRYRGKLGELKGTRVKLPSHSSIASHAGLLEQPLRLSTRHVKNGTGVGRPIPLANLHTRHLRQDPQHPRWGIGFRDIEELSTSRGPHVADGMSAKITKFSLLSRSL